MKAQHIEIDENGHKFYYSDREMQILHREDGPAIEWFNGSKSWWVNGRLHREDGPAAIWHNGRKSWYLNDERVSEAEHKQLTAKETVLTMDEIATKFGISVEQLKIKK